ncbi:hypothetical protein ACHQM5_012982 [Ranunculus cassubicifolius]
MLRIIDRSNNLLYLLPFSFLLNEVVRKRLDKVNSLQAARTKFFVVCEPGAQHMENLLKVIYELYTDYVLKNPFYEMEMPIRCELFDLNLSVAVNKDRVALLGR